MNVVWSPLALEKLGDAADFIALDNPVAAERWVNALVKKISNWIMDILWKISKC